MAKYIDSSSYKKSHDTRNFLAHNLLPDIKALRIQSGYFRYGGILPFLDAIEAVASAGRIVRFVLGANDGDLSSEDVKDMLGIIQTSSKSSLTIVRFENAKFHPKCYHIERCDGSSAAVVGSANLTESGISRNIEASIVLDTAAGDQPALLKSVSASIDSWASRTTDQGAYQVKTAKDIDRLHDLKILDIPQPPRTSSPSRSSKGKSPLAKVKSRWPSVKRKSKTSTRKPTGSKRQPRSGNARLGTVTHRWSKKLKPSDAQQVDKRKKKPTKPTSNLRLSKSGHDIDHKTWFRKTFFGDSAWNEEVRYGKSYEVTNVLFRVSIMGHDLGELTLKVDYAPHRIAAQNNTPTVLIWGHDLMRHLTQKSMVDKYVILTKYDSGIYTLEITAKRPA